MLDLIVTCSTRASFLATTACIQSRSGGAQQPTMVLCGADARHTVAAKDGLLQLDGMHRHSWRLSFDKQSQHLFALVANVYMFVDRYCARCRYLECCKYFYPPTVDQRQLARPLPVKLRKAIAVMIRETSSVDQDSIQICAQQWSPTPQQDDQGCVVTHGLLCVQQMLTVCIYAILHVVG